MEIYKSGLTVKILNTEIIGTISACMIRENNILYEISYFSNGIYYLSCMSEYEFEVIDKNTKKEKIGFK